MNTSTSTCSSYLFDKYDIILVTNLFKFDCQNKAFKCNINQVRNMYPAATMCASVMFDECFRYVLAT